MKTIGLIGGMSWESTSEYYRIINETVKRKLGGLHSARCILYSVDFYELELLQQQDRWDDMGEILGKAAASLQLAGADFIILCTNTMHKLVDQIQPHINIPILHIADATAEKIKASGIEKIGLLGTRFTMEEDFYKKRLTEKYKFDVLVPELDDRIIIHRIIFDELCLGIVKTASRGEYTAIIKRLVQNGAQGIVLGCTEIELLVRAEDSPVPVFPTTQIHAIAAVEYALS